MRLLPKKSPPFMDIIWQLFLCDILISYIALIRYVVVASPYEYDMCELGIEGYEYKIDSNGDRICVAICLGPCENGGSCITPGKCSCAAGFKGDTCSEECEPGWYGIQCMNQCACKNGACDHVTGGKCTCYPGYSGSTCVFPCETGFFGSGCNQKCPEECSSAVGIDVTSKICYRVSGTCYCLKGKYGTTCSLTCQAESDDPACENNICSCQNGGNCTEVEKICKCAPGFTGSQCEHECPEGRFGFRCQQFCQHCQHGSCDKTSGVCRCEKGWDGFNCSEPCPAGTFGNQCEETCSCPFNLDCDPVEGLCLCEGIPENLKNCSVTYKECPKGLYGVYCSHTCQCGTGYCDRTTGECKAAETPDGSKVKEVIMILTLVVALIGVISTTLILIICRKRKHRSQKNQTGNNSKIREKRP